MPEKIEEELNELRKKCLLRDTEWKVITLILSVVTVLYILGVLFYKLDFISYPLNMIIAALLILLTLGSIYFLPRLFKTERLYRAYSEKYKMTFLKPVLETDFPGSQYMTQDKVSVKEITELSMLRKAKYAHANDVLRGNVNGISFERFDLAMRLNKKSDVSDCVIINCNIKTHLDENVQVISNRFKMSGDALTQPEKYCKVLSGNEEFDKEYTVYAKNQKDGKDLLSSSFIKGLLDLKLGGPAAIFLDEKKIYCISLRKKDVMEAPIYSKPKQEKCEKEANKEARIVRNWMDFLKKEFD